MKPIRQLDYALINKIAAGEVVERPLSVVKELTENAIDAGASVITVEIRDGGLAMIRVTDNGSGIPAEDLSLAFARHATSKIVCAEDLYEVMTMGFRGEALSSISAISQVEMITKTREAITGIRVEIQGGQEVAKQEIGCADGTTVVVSNLFFNTPARRKFLKKPSTEAAAISDIMQKLALANPGLSIRYINNGQSLLQTNGNHDVKQIIHQIYGRETAVKMIALESEEAGFSLTGLVGKPETARANRSYGHFFLNGRYIQSRLLRQAVESAMKTMLPSGKFPVYALYLTMPPGAVDVNVHPSKLDVRFADEEGVYQFVYNTVKKSLTDHSLIPEVLLAPRRTILPEPDTYETQTLWRTETPKPEPRSKPTTVPVPLSIPVDIPVKYVNHPVLPGKDDGRLIFQEEHKSDEEAPAAPFFRDYIILGLLFKTYWLVAQGDSLYLIDQHAAHERVLYEEFAEALRSGPIHAQPLLNPVRLRLTPQEADRLHNNQGFFTRAGFEVDNGEDIVEIRAVPFLLKGPVTPAFFTELLDKLERAGSHDGSIIDYKINAVAMMACKAAVKANDMLTEAEARSLIVKMLALENPFTCPHGRPTIIEITRHELERKFKRVN